MPPTSSPPAVSQRSQTNDSHAKNDKTLTHCSHLMLTTVRTYTAEAQPAAGSRKCLIFLDGGRRSATVAPHSSSPPLLRAPHQIRSQPRRRRSIAPRRFKDRSATNYPDKRYAPDPMRRTGRGLTPGAEGGGRETVADAGLDVGGKRSNRRLDGLGLNVSLVLAPDNQTTQGVPRTKNAESGGVSVPNNFASHNWRAWRDCFKSPVPASANLVLRQGAVKSSGGAIQRVLSLACSAILILRRWVLPRVESRWRRSRNVFRRRRRTMTGLDLQPRQPTTHSLYHNPLSGSSGGARDPWSLFRYPAASATNIYDNEAHSSYTC